MKKTLILPLLLMMLHIPAAADTLTVGQAYQSIPEHIYDYSMSLFTSEQTLQQRLYAHIEQELLNGADQINVLEFNIAGKGVDGEHFNMTFAECFDIYCSVVYNNPQLCSLQTGLSYSYYPSSGKIVYLNPMRLDGCDMEKFDAEVDRALSICIAPDMSDIDKLLSLHDYLADTIEYAADNDASYTAYGALVGKRAVCQGYSLAYKLLCSRAGIDCGYAITDQSANHMWNVVCLEDEYYNIDVTWDDATSRVQYNGNVYTHTGNITHKYFLNNDEQCQANHRYTYKNWTSDRPECTDGGLYQNLVYTSQNINAKMTYCKGSFWYKERKLRYYADTDEVKLCETGNLYRLDGNRLVKVDENDYLPDVRLQCVMHNVFDGRLAIDGASGQSATLYAAQYDNGALVSVDKSEIVFDENGRCLADIGEYSKIMLMNDMKPMAYSIEK